MIVWSLAPLSASSVDEGVGLSCQGAPYRYLACRQFVHLLLPAADTDQIGRFANFRLVRNFRGAPCHAGLCIAIFSDDRLGWLAYSKHESDVFQRLSEEKIDSNWQTFCFAPYKRAQYSQTVA